MHIPLVHGTIKRRLLVNYRAAPDVVQALLPSPFRPKQHEGHAIVGVCLIRLEHIRPAGLPGFVGVSSENAAHRIAIEWEDANGDLLEGVFVPRRDTGSVFNRLAGGRLFPGQQNGARFSVEDDGDRINFTMESLDKAVRVKVVGQSARTLPPGSCFSSPEESSAFFEGGSLGYSVTRDPGRLDALRLHTLEWNAAPLDVESVSSSFFQDRDRFPDGTVEFVHALIMRDLAHEWRPEKDLATLSPSQTHS